MDKKDKNKQGFTMIELMVVLGITALLATMGLPALNLARVNIALKSDTDEIVSALRLAQHRAVVSQGNTVHGVAFEAANYTLYGGDWAAPSNPAEYSLKSGISIAAGAGTQVVFDRLTGVASPGTITITAAGRNKTVTVNEWGQISVQ
jgi:prepilin-type N-terminal cleavage/methylation domain-containing protein